MRVSGENGAGRAAAAINQQVAIADAGKKLEPVVAQFLLRRLSSSAASAVEIWPAVKLFITWSSIVTRLQRTAQSSGPSSIPWAAASNGGAAGEMLERVVAQQAQIGHVGARRQRLGRVVGPADHARGRHGVHAGMLAA